MQCQEVDPQGVLLLFPLAFSGLSGFLSSFSTSALNWDPSGCLSPSSTLGLLCETFEQLMDGWRIAHLLHLTFPAAT
jgi:hypothetical protein